jgi:hypothetical protein
LGAVLLLLGCAGPALAAERTYSVTDFDRLDVSGPFVVVVTTGKSPGANANGGREAIDRLTVETVGRTLRIRPGINGWGGWPGALSVTPTIKVSVPMLRAANLNGSGSITISKLRGQSLQIAVIGSGQLNVAQIETDRLFASNLGSGGMTLSGKAAIATLALKGTGPLNAKDLRVDALELTATGAGDAQISAAKTAKIISTGTGNVDIIGTPACSVTANGAGRVKCGVN